MKLPILMYHSISDGNNPLSVPIKNFEKQMKFMSHNGYKSINLKDLSNLNRNDKFFIITFDDGYEDVFVNALPILNKYNFTATCFFVSKYLGKHNIWDENKSNYIKLNLMNKEQVYEWHKNGMEVGSHSLDHKNLKDLDYNDKYSQITEPKKTFHELFSIDIKTFSYPFGGVDAQTVEIVRNNYSYAVTTNRSRFTFNKFDNYKLPRVPINKTDSIFKFYLKVNTIYEDIKFKS
jgi:peptidoglycan/xylan/chitin deacetylase (PgdA/CDA1 family)